MSEKKRKKKPKSRQDLSVQSTSLARKIIKKTKGKIRGGIRADKGSTVVVVGGSKDIEQQEVTAENGSMAVHIGGVDGINIHCSSATNTTVVNNNGEATTPKDTHRKTKSFLSLFMDWDKDYAKVDGKEMTIQEAIQQGYATNIGAVVGQKGGVCIRNFTFN